MPHDPDKPHCLPCPYKPVAQKQDVEELTGEAKDKAFAEFWNDLAPDIIRSYPYGPQWEH